MLSQQKLILIRMKRLNNSLPKKPPYKLAQIQRASSLHYEPRVLLRKKKCSIITVWFLTLNLKTIKTLFILPSAIPTHILKFLRKCWRKKT